MITATRGPRPIDDVGEFADGADRIVAVGWRTVTTHVDAAVRDVAPAAATSSRHVVFIGVDGAQYDQILKHAPRMLAGLDHLEATTGGAVGTKTEQPTVSGPGWSTLLTGVWANRHGITGNDPEPIRAKVDSLFERIDDAELGSQASITSWEPLNEGFFAREMGYLNAPSIVRYQASGVSDDRVVARTVDLIADAAPAFTFAYLGDVDNVGHASGFGREYTQALREAGRQIDLIQEAVAAREAANPNEDWMIVISTDHGREKSGYGHGGQSDGERQIFIAADEPLSAEGVPDATSVAATILDFLGLDTRGIKGPSLLADAAFVADTGGDRAWSPADLHLAAHARLDVSHLVLV